MATKKNSVTRLAVITKALKLDGVWTDEERDVLERMATSLAKPHKKAEGPTKGQLENANLARQLVEAMKAHGEPVTTKWITEHVPGVMTSQKAVAICKAAGEQIVRFYEGRQAYYRVA